MYRGGDRVDRSLYPSRGNSSRGPSERGGGYQQRGSGYVPVMYLHQHENVLCWYCAELLFTSLFANCVLVMYLLFSISYLPFQLEI